MSVQPHFCMLVLHLAAHSRHKTTPPLLPFNRFFLQWTSLFPNLRDGLYGHIGNFDVVELILADRMDGIGPCGKLRSANCAFVNVVVTPVHSVQMPIAIAETLSPTTAFLTRYGRRARIRAADWRLRLS